MDALFQCRFLGYYTKAVRAIKQKNTHVLEAELQKLSRPSRYIQTNAVVWGNINLLEILADHGYVFDDFDLEIAAQKREPDVLDWLLEHATPATRYPLIVALSHGNLAAADKLRKYNNSKLDQEDVDTLLYRAKNENLNALEDWLRLHGYNFVRDTGVKPNKSCVQI